MAKIEILKVGHALIAGKRGENGGAPSKDSIFGVAIIAGNKLVTFGGRRNGMQKFKAYPMVQKDAQLERYAFKLTGKDKGFAYTDLDVAAQAELLGATFADDLAKMYYINEQKKNVNRRAFQKPSAQQPKGKAAAASAMAKAPKYKAADPKKVFEFPTQASVAHAAEQAAKAAMKAAKAAPAEAQNESMQAELPLAA